jgi:small subunit ribosomal protein S13
MARVAGIDLPKNKRAVIGLTAIFGIGKSTAEKILDKVGVDHNKKVANLTDDEVNHIRTEITNEYKVEGSLKSEVQMNIKRLTDIGTYRGKRHRKGLPTRGQRTRTNSRTRKGKRKTVAGKKKVAAKK